MTVTDGASPEVNQVGVNVVLEPFNNLTEHTADLAADRARAVVELGVVLPATDLSVSTDTKIDGSVDFVEHGVVEAQNLDPASQAQKVIDESVRARSGNLYTQTVNHQRLIGRLLLKERCSTALITAGGIWSAVNAHNELSHHRNAVLPIASATFFGLALIFGDNQSGRNWSRQKNIVAAIQNDAEELGAIKLVQHSFPKPEQTE